MLLVWPCPDLNSPGKLDLVSSWKLAGPTLARTWKEDLQGIPGPWLRGRQWQATSGEHPLSPSPTTNCIHMHHTSSPKLIFKKLVLCLPSLLGFHIQCSICNIKSIVWEMLYLIWLWKDLYPAFQHEVLTGKLTTIYRYYCKKKHTLKIQEIKRQ